MPARAQDGQNNRRYSFTFDDVSTEAVLNTLARDANLSILYESSLLQDQHTTCQIREAALDDLMACVLDGTGIGFRVLDSGTIVLTSLVTVNARNATLIGRVLDSESDSPVQNANVLVRKIGIGAATDEDGHFLITGLRPGKYTIAVTHVAYLDFVDTLDVRLEARNRLDIRLIERTIRSAPIVVNDVERPPSSEDLGLEIIPVTELRDNTNVEASGAFGILRQTPGIQTSGSLSSTHIQGSGAGDHEYLIDGAPVFVPLKNGGFIGSMSSFAIRSLHVHKAGFDARYGSHLSGVIAIEHEIGGERPIVFDVQATPLSVEGELKGTVRSGANRVISYMVAARTSLTDGIRPDGMNRRFRVWGTPDVFLSNALGLGNPSQASQVNAAYVSSPVSVQYTDFHAATRVSFGGWKNLYASFYSGSNLFGTGALTKLTVVEGDSSEGNTSEVENATSDEYTWTNRVGQIRYNWIQGSSTLVRIAGWLSSYNLRNPSSANPLSSGTGLFRESEGVFNRVTMAGLRAGIDIGLSSRNTASISLEMRHTDSDFSLNADPRNGSRIITPRTIRPAAWSWHLLTENVYKPGDRFSLTIGSRLTYVASQQRMYAEPRISIRTDTRGSSEYAWSFRLSGGLYRQFLNKLDVASASFSAILPGFRFWIPLGLKEHPPTAYHAAFSTLLTLRRQTVIRGEVFYKFLKHVVDINYADPGDTSARLLTSGRGRVYGASVSAEYSGALVGLRVGYELTRSRRSLDGRFSGREIPTAWEQPHVVTAAFDGKIYGGWTVAATWQGIFGRSWAFRQAYYDYLAPVEAQQSPGGYDLTRPDQQHLPAYSQVDASVSWGRSIGKGNILIKLSVINLLDRSNVLDRSLVDAVGSGIEARNRVDLPFISFLSARIRF